MVYKDLCRFIKEENLYELDKLVKELENLVHREEYSNRFIQDTVPLIKGYYKIVCKYARESFEKQSICEFENIEETVAWKLGFIKAYCEMILK